MPPPVDIAVLAMTSPSLHSSVSACRSNGYIGLIVKSEDRGSSYTEAIELPAGPVDLSSGSAGKGDGIAITKR